MQHKRWYRLGLALALSLALLAFWLIGQRPPSQGAPPAPDWWTPGNVVINEVAWMGTVSNWRHEWIELHNPGHLTVSVEGWRLITLDGMNIQLTGEIAPRGYYLVMHSDVTISDIVADVVSSFAQGNYLLNDGEAITLTNALGEPVDTANAPGGTWPAGTNSPKHTMERIDPLAPDTPDNWADNDGVIRNGHDADGNPINGTPRATNSATAPLHATRADLEVSLSGPAEVIAGDTVSYVVSLINYGGHVAAGTQLTKTLPPVAEFLYQESAFTFTESAPILLWELGDVPTAVRHTITITARITDSAPGGILTSPLTATTVTTEPYQLNNITAWIAYVQPLLPNLEAGKTGPPTIVAGELITYHLCLTNTGRLPASAVRLTDTLPAEVAFVTQTSAFTFTERTPTLLWELGEVLPGAAPCITLTGQIAPTAVGSITNHITATTITEELTTTNNVAAWETVVIPPTADLSISKTGPLTAAIASRITYTIHLSNTGDYPAEGTRITDTLPIGIDLVAQESTFGFSHIGQTLTWDVGTVLPGDTHVITLTGQLAADAGGLLTNRITATTVTSDVDPGNNVAAWTTQVGEAYVLISGVLYDGYQPNDTDEAVQLVNAGTAPATLIDWQLCKDVSYSFVCRTLPDISINVGQRVWIARESVPFSISFGFPPDYVLNPWLNLTDAGDEVLLRDAEGNFIDTVVYKAGQLPMPGWHGPAIQPYRAGRETGQILYRIPDEVTGLPIADTDTAADWIQSTHDPLLGRRVLYPGWALDPLFWPLQVTEPATVMVGITPDNAYTVIHDLLTGARESIKIEIYTLRHPDIMLTLIEQANAGVEVTLLLEGSPVGLGENHQDWQTQLWLCQELEMTGNGACWFMVNKSTAPRIFSRYRFIHAKMVIVDDTWAIIGTQNFTSSSLPSDDKSAGTYGSRGALIATNAPGVVQRALDIFELDLGDGRHYDILRWSASNTGDFYSKYGPPIIPPDLSTWDAISYTVQFPEPLVISGTFDFELLTAPEAALRQSDSLLGLVNRAGAGDTIYVAQLYEYAAWGDGPNVRLDAYTEAARRGAKVRIILNGQSFAEHLPEPPENRHTLNVVHEIARAEGLDMSAVLANTTGNGIHSKIVLVYLQNEGGYAHVGSINGSENSSKLNREVALQIRSNEVYAYLAASFEYDWWMSSPVMLPLVMRNYTPPAPPVNYLVISEVYYATGNVERQWVEIYNPTPHIIDLSDYKIGDAETPDRFEAMYRFPDKAMIAPGGVVVIAGRGGNAGVPQADYELFNLSETPTMIRYTAWGTGEWNLANAGDQVLLLGPDDTPVDVVVWGNATYPGVIPHPGVENWLHSLQRVPVYYDTDDCSVDFRSWYPPSPGHVDDQMP